MDVITFVYTQFSMINILFFPMYLFATLLGSRRLHHLTTLYGEYPVCSPQYSVDSVGVDDLGFIDRSS
jgi:hypothetical protein